MKTLLNLLNKAFSFSTKDGILSLVVSFFGQLFTTFVHDVHVLHVLRICLRSFLRFFPVLYSI